MLAVVGLGSNVGDRAATIARAIATLQQLPGVSSARASALYETEPVGGPPQGKYLNAAIALTLEPHRSARSLVQALLAIERSLGRARGDERFGPRTIDLDLLWTDGPPSDHPDAVVPHPRLHERAFALVPLVEVAPNARDREGEPYAAILARLGEEGVTRFESRHS